MSAVWLFSMGVLVTVVVSVGLALPVYGAILDGRDETRRKAAEVERATFERGAGRRSAA